MIHNPSREREYSNVLSFFYYLFDSPISVARINKTWTIINQQLFSPVFGLVFFVEN